jgi:predicted TIM-barrel fold metal-dependent hydrolase
VGANARSEVTRPLAASTMRGQETQEYEMTVANKERLVSLDSHVHFTDDWVKARMPSRLHSVWDDANVKYRDFEEKELRRGAPNLHIEDFVDMEKSKDPGHFEPDGKLKAMDRDGIQAEVIFPEVGGTKLCTPTMSGSDWMEMIGCYNDSMADFASLDNARLLTAYQIPLFDIPFAVKEVERLAKAGARCVQLPSYPSEYGLPDVYNERYDPLWTAISEAGLTIFNHLEIKSSIWDVFRRDPTPQRGIFTAIPAMALSEPLMFWILTGTLERFPKLNVILVEPGLGWLPSFIEKLDMRMHLHYQFPNMKKMPSEYFKTQMGATFMYEPSGLKAAYDAFGPECLYWSTDFPHPATCWPESREKIDEQFEGSGIPAADRAKITSGNAMRLFGLKA